MRGTYAASGLVAALLAAPLAASPPDAALPPEQRHGVTIEQTIDAAESGNIDVLTARLAVDTARANLRSADTSPNPVLSVNAVQSRPGQYGRLPVAQLADTIARVDLPVERGGKRQARVGAARASIDAAVGDLGNTRRQIRFAVIGAYYDLKAAEDRLAALQAIADAYAQSDRIAGTQQRAGALSEGELARERVEALGARTDAERAYSAWRDGQQTLAGLVGREGDVMALATVGAWPVAGAVAGERPDAIAAQRPDVLAAIARVEAARRNLDGAHALRHPDITIGAQFERSDPPLGVGKSLGVGFAVPLPVLNRYRGEVDAAGTALVQAEAQSRRSLAVATAEIVAARRSLQEASERRRLFEEAQLPAARKAASVAEFAYKNGALTLIELLDARRSLRSTELGAIDAHVDEARAIARLQAAQTVGVN